MRGKASPARRNQARKRITPAYAGKRNNNTPAFPGLEDHPRVCGEKGERIVAFVSNVGSPPRMRGKGQRPRRGYPFRGITPAYAGKRRSSMLGCAAAWDHPRVCGEKKVAGLDAVKVQGSPPRMRGKEGAYSGIHPKGGITPAYAGKRLKRSRSTVSPVAIVPLFPSVCNKPVVSDGSPAVRDVPLFLPAENAVPASPACNLRSL